MVKNFKRVIAIVISIMLITTMIPMNLVSAAVAETQSVGLKGTGTADDPYLIYNADDYKEFANLVNNGSTSISANLMDDITFNTDVVSADGDLNDGNFESVTVIGASGKYFNGTFNGNGHTIKGAYIVSADNYTGLFGLLDTSAIVENLNVEDSYVKGTYYVAGICAYNTGSIADCTFEGLVEGTSYVGGISGWNTKYGYGDAVTHCANFGKVKATGQNAGGVVAYVYNTTVTNCYNTGAVSGGYNVGGVVGYNDKYAQVSNCHNVGAVTGTSNYVGAICGRDSASIKNCYYLDEDIVTDGDGTLQNGIGYYSKGQSQADIEGNTDGYWDDMFEGGLVTYELNDGVTDGTQIWYQTLGEDMYPVFSDKTVYLPEPECPMVEPWFSNESDGLGHEYENGFCVHCDAYEPATDSDNDGYYEIDNGGKLYWFATQVNNGDNEINAVLTDDIYVNEDVLDDDGMNKAGVYREWTPIGNNDIPFYGTFDGKNHTISGLYFNDNTVDYVGLIGKLYGVAQNIGLLDSYFYGATYTGGIVGYNIGDVDYCYNEGFIRGSSYTGGIVGDNRGGISYCGNTGRVLSSQFAGGIAGHKRTGSLYNCYSTGYVMAYSYVGSICGSAYGFPSHCYYLPKTATNGSGEYEDGIGGLVEEEDTTTAKTAEQFASGEVTYLMNKGVTDGTQVWYQTIGTDNVPKFTGETVYYGYVGCNSTDKVYSNTELNSEVPDHNYVNGFCSVCDAYEPATESYYNNWYEIDNGGKLYWFATQVNNGDKYICAELTTDIYVNENVLNEDGTLKDGNYREWIVIGNSYDNIYSGTFDGQGHTISGLYYNNQDLDCTGLIGYMEDGYVENMGIVDSYFFTDECYSIGAICGGCQYSEITNCFNESTIIASDGDVGGICGSPYYSTIKDCYNKGLVEGNNYVGGICGSAYYSTVKDCYNTGFVEGNNYVGGICGNNGFVGGVIVDGCYNTGRIKGDYCVGGIFGMFGEELDESMIPTSEITKCYNTGDIIATSSYAGGIGGEVFGIKITNCYNTGSVSGESCLGGIIGSHNQLSELSYSYNIGEVTGTSYNVGSICGENAATIEKCYYIGNTAFDGNDRRQYGIGTSTLGDNQYDTKNCTIETWNIELQDGRITYALNNGVTDGTQAWYQTIGVNRYPVFEGATVYAKYVSCAGDEKVYSNTELLPIRPDHNFENGFCKVCDAYEPAVDTDNDGYYEIDNGGKLYWFANQVSSGNNKINAVLTKDIKVNENVLDSEGNLALNEFRHWTPIGNSVDGSTKVRYYGHFIGNGHTISGLVYNNSTAKDVGLFGVIEGKIESIGLLDSYFCASEDVGAFVGLNVGEIIECYSESSVKAVDIYAGGITGYNGGTIQDCYNNGKVTGTNSIGGILGHNGSYGLANNCYNTGDVIGDVKVGAIAGYIYRVITNCYYLEGVAIDGSGTVQNGCGTYISGETYEDIDGATFAKTSEQFASGEVTYLLNNSVTDGTQAWYQTIGTDNYPIFEADTVYYGYQNCKSTDKTYSNTKLYDEIPTHNFENGYCTICGEKDPTEDVTIYLKPNSNWIKDDARFTAYVWNDDESTFIDMTDSDGDGYYEVTVKNSWDNIIFCRLSKNVETAWGNVWNQTKDLVIPYDGRNCYTIAEGAWSLGEGTWGVYDPVIPTKKTVNVFGDINIDLDTSDEVTFTGAVELDAGTYKFNVNDNGTIVGFNYTFTDTATIDYSAGYKAATTLVVTGGRYIFTYNNSAKKLTISYKPFAEIVELFGDINVELVRPYKDSTLFTGSVRVDAGSYNFKINDQGTEMGFGYIFEDVVYNVEYRSDWQGITTFNATGGIYSIKYDTATNKLTFMHAAAGLGEVSVFGDINLPLANQGNNVYSAQITLEAGTYQFRIDALGKTVCNGATFTDTMNGVEYKTDWKAATTFVATEKQKFTFIFDTNTNKIKVFNAPIDVTKVLVAFENSTLELKTTDGVNYTATTSLEAGTYTFRMDEFGVTMGYGGTYTDVISGVKYNASFKAATTFVATGGEYTFNFKTTTDVLTVEKG